MQFDGPPGPLQMRIVEGQRGQVIDSVSRDLTLPDFTRVQVSLATPRVFRGRTVRDLTAIKTNPSLLFRPPTATSRGTDRLLIRTEAYTPGGAAPALTARLLNRGGGQMAVLPVQAGPGGVGDIDLPLLVFAAGDNPIELNAKRTQEPRRVGPSGFKVGRATRCVGRHAEPFSEHPDGYSPTVSIFRLSRGPTPANARAPPPREDRPPAGCHEQGFGG